MNLQQWYAQDKHVLWKKLLAKEPIIGEAFEVVLRTTMAIKTMEADVDAHALQNAKRDGIFGSLQMLEDLLTRIPTKEEQKNLKPWTKHKLDEHSSDKPTANS